MEKKIFRCSPIYSQRGTLFTPSTNIKDLAKNRPIRSNANPLLNSYCPVNQCNATDTCTYHCSRIDSCKPVYLSSTIQACDPLKNNSKTSKLVDFHQSVNRVIPNQIMVCNSRNGTELNRSRRRNSRNETYRSRSSSSSSSRCGHRCRSGSPVLNINIQTSKNTTNHECQVDSLCFKNLRESQSSYESLSSAQTKNSKKSFSAKKKTKRSSSIESESVKKNTRRKSKRRSISVKTQSNEKGLRSKSKRKSFSGKSSLHKNSARKSNKSLRDNYKKIDDSSISESRSETSSESNASIKNKNILHKKTKIHSSRSNQCKFLANNARYEACSNKQSPLHCILIDNLKCNKSVGCPEAFNLETKIKNIDCILCDGSPYCRQCSSSINILQKIDSTSFIAGCNASCQTDLFSMQKIKRYQSPNSSKYTNCLLSSKNKSNIKDKRLCKKSVSLSSSKNSIESYVARKHMSNLTSKISFSQKKSDNSDDFSSFPLKCEFPLNISARIAFNNSKINGSSGLFCNRIMNNFLKKRSIGCQALINDSIENSMFDAISMDVLPFTKYCFTNKDTKKCCRSIGCQFPKNCSIQANIIDNDIQTGVLMNSNFCKDHRRDCNQLPIKNLTQNRIIFSNINKNHKINKTVHACAQTDKSAKYKISQFQNLTINPSNVDSSFSYESYKTKENSKNKVSFLPNKRSTTENISYGQNNMPYWEEIFSSPIVQPVISNVATILQQNGFILGENIILKGSYCTVIQCLKMWDKKRHAVKIIDHRVLPQDFILNFLPRMLNIIDRLSHPNIVKIAMKLSFNDMTLHIMETEAESTLTEYISKNGKLSEENAKIVFGCLVNALQYLHLKKIAHRNIKCDNILMSSNGWPEFMDFSLSKEINYLNSYHTNLSDSFCGTMAYAAPEILKSEKYDPLISDIWSLGVVLYVLVNGGLPYDDSNLPKMIKNQEKGKFQTFEYWSFDYKNLIISMLEHQPRHRLCINRVSQSLWLQSR